MNIARYREDIFRAFLINLKSTIILEWRILGSMTHSLTVTQTHGYSDSRLLRLTVHGATDTVHGATDTVHGATDGLTDDPRTD